MKTLQFIILSVLSSLIYGQDQGLKKPEFSDENRFIRWVAELPSDEIKESRGLFEKIFNLIVGEDPVIFNSPIGVVAKGIQDYYIVNQGNGTIINFQNGKTSTLAPFKKSDRFYPSLVAICALDENDFLFSDSRLNRVFILSEKGSEVRNFNHGDSLTRPTGVAYSAITGDVYVVETGSHCVSVFDKNGNKKRTIGRRGNGPLEFNFPTYIWIDRSGKIYIVDSMNFRVQVLSDRR